MTIITNCITNYAKANMDAIASGDRRAWLVICILIMVVICAVVAGLMEVTK